MGEGNRQSRSGGWGSHIVIRGAPTPSASGGGVGSWRWGLLGGSNMLRQLVLGCVYPTASLPGETIFEKQHPNLDLLGVWEFCGGACRPSRAHPPRPTVPAFLAPPSVPSRGRAGTFPGRKSFRRSDLDPSCCDFSKSRLLLFFASPFLAPVSLSL